MIQDRLSLSIASTCAAGAIKAYASRLAHSLFIMSSQSSNWNLISLMKCRDGLIANASTRKIALYSAHDFLLSTRNVFKTKLNDINEQSPHCKFGNFHCPLLWLCLSVTSREDGGKARPLLAMNFIKLWLSGVNKNRSKG